MSNENYPDFLDRDDFDAANSGHVVSFDGFPIMNDNSNVELPVFDATAYNFLTPLGYPGPEIANRSLWRQGELCLKSGLFRVYPKEADGPHGIYQVRGLDISTMTFVETFNADSSLGVLVIDPLTSIECARAAIELYLSHRPGRRIEAMIYTHSHVDHFGGSGAVMEDSVTRANPFKIIAPEGFLDHAVSENVYAGIAMPRRAVYMYGQSLEPAPNQHIGTGLGISTSRGTGSLVAPTDTISETLIEPGEATVIAGLQILFQVTPGTEAPSEMNFFFPQYNTLCMSENACHTLHNIQTLRGALVRDAKMWSRYIDDAIVAFIRNPNYTTNTIIASHHWPTFGHDKSLLFLEAQRDLYAYLHNETLRQLNNGQTGLEIAETFQLPISLQDKWYLRGYYGSVSHNVKAIYNRYMGWYDGNPAHLWEYPPRETAERWAECMTVTSDATDGVDKLVKLGQFFFSKSPPDARFAATLLSHAVFANQDHLGAREALAEVFTYLGRRAENATWRNIYLVGAKELIDNQITPVGNSMDPNTYEALEMDQLMDTWAIRFNGPVAGNPDLTTPSSFTIDFMVDNWATIETEAGTEWEHKAWRLNMSNGVVTGHVISFIQHSDGVVTGADFSLWPTRTQLATLVSLKKPTGPTFEFNVEGSVEIWLLFASLITEQSGNWAIVTPENPQPTSRHVHLEKWRTAP